MLRKFTLAFITLFIIYVTCDSSYAAMKKEKYTDPVLRACTMYQLGENEIILKLSGKNLPTPEYESQNNSLSITFNECKIYHPDSIVSSLNAIAESIPMIYEVKAENVSENESFWSAVTLKSNSPLKVFSLSRSHDGWQFRIKSDKKNELMPGSMYTPPPKNTAAPQTSLPFSVDTRISLELRDAELVDVIRGIMAYIGRNVIIDPSFPGSVVITMSLSNVRADDILNYIMRTYDLACYTSSENTLTFGTREGLYKLSGGMIIKEFKINFAEPSQVSTILNALAALEAGAVTVDDRMKSIYVKTNPAKMEEVEELIEIIDAPQKQVMIKASIFEFSDSNTLEVEHALELMYDDIRVNLGGALGIEHRVDRSINGPRTVWTDRVVKNTLTALEHKAKGKVLANPSVIAIDGKQAEINLTQDYPYISDKDDQKGTVTWSTEEVGPKLSFTPRIGRDGYVTLTLNLSTGNVIGTQVSSTSEQMPITTTRSVKTEIRIRDGMPFVIGGLFMENNTKTVSRIPILGSIPLLGELFTMRGNDKTKSQVVMVITPYILDTI